MYMKNEDGQENHHISLGSEYRQNYTSISCFFLWWRRVLAHLNFTMQPATLHTSFGKLCIFLWWSFRASILLNESPQLHLNVFSPSCTDLAFFLILNLKLDFLGQPTSLQTSLETYQDFPFSGSIFLITILVTFMFLLLLIIVDCLTLLSFLVPLNWK